MPKSRRDKTVTLTRTKSKKCPETKTKLKTEIEACLDEYAYLFVFTVKNMRNERWKQLRLELKHSRFFFGRNKVMQHALGRTAETERRPSLHRVAAQLVGQCGLLFTNRTQQEVQAWADRLSGAEFARAGCHARETVQLTEGPLEQFPHSMEPHLRSLGLTTSLQRGVVTLDAEHTVCTAGQLLRPEQCRLLKLLGLQQAEFRVLLRSVWTASSGQLQQLSKLPEDQPLPPSDTEE